MSVTPFLLQAEELGKTIRVTHTHTQSNTVFIGQKKKKKPKSEFRMLIKKKKGTQRHTHEIKKSGGDKLELNETSPLSVNNVQIIADRSFCIMMCVRE